MSLIRGPGRFLLSCNPNIHRAFFHRQHIGRIQFKAHRAMLRRFRAVQKNGIPRQRKAAVHIQPSVIIHEDSRIELKWFILFAYRHFILIFYISIEFILSCRFITDCHRDHLCAAHKIIQIVFSVRPLYHIRSRQPIRQADPGRRRILLPFINTALISPVA